MPHEEIETLSGHLERLLFSPKGDIEGLLMTVASETVQVSLEPSAVDAGTATQAVGKLVEVKASADHSPKTKAGAHPVYKLDALVKVGGKAVKSNGRAHPVSGVVAAIHYAKHGEPNGVILESGEFIHTRPPGMKKLKLQVGSKVTAYGDIRKTVLGTPLIEAHEVNRVALD